MTHSGLRTNIREAFAVEEQAAKYPYLLITNFGRELPLLLQGLRVGELPVVVFREGKLLSVGSCTISALELNKILQVYTYDIVLSRDDKRHIDSINSIMEVLPWMVS